MNKRKITASENLTSRKGQWASFAVAFLLLAVLAWTGTIVAQGPISPTQFDVTGFLQEATLTTPGDAHSGGQLKVNGHVITVPRETIVVLPANQLTWQELFAQSPAPYTNVSTGLAMADVPTPLTQYEVEAVGNRVGDTYIAGLIYISQQTLNSGAGFINFIDYTLGEMRVGGVINDANCAQGGTAASNPLCSGARVRLNDPTGKFGRANTPDQRFTLDPDNPTVMSGTGYPACLPRTDPAGAAPDALCPEGQRPKDLTGAYVGKFFTNAPVAAPGVTPMPDPNIQAPFEVGDYITFAGTLVTDNAAAPTAGPWPANGAAGTYISAHTITSNVAIFTAAGTAPAYVMTDTFILGTGGLTVLGAAEAVIRTRFEGMTTDFSRQIHLYGLDYNASTGAPSDRDWGTIGVDPGPPAGAVLGRWRFRPPCAPFGTVPTKPDKQCVMNALGVFLPATREMRAVIEGAWVPGQTTTYANGLIAGQYHAPITELIFPENIPGSPIVPNNFEAIPFLACGGYSSTTGVLGGQLSPWPGAAAPSLANCAGAVTPPVANAGLAQTVASGAAVTLNGSATGTAPLTFAWAQNPADATQVVLTGANTANPTFTAPVVGVTTVLNFTLTVTNSAGSSSASVTVTVDAAAAPTVSVPAPQTVISGTLVTLTATCTDPLGLACTFSWLQTAPAAPVVINPNPFSGATISFTLTLPVGTTTSTVLQFQVIATNSAGVSSSAGSTSVTVNPAPDAVIITSAVYRISKQRLDLTASSSVISPNIILTLQPYVTTSGATFNPLTLGAGSNIMTNTGGGLYTMTLVGAPEPAVPPATPIIVTSNIGGRATSALTLIRQ